MLIAAAATKTVEAEECKSPENLKLFKLKWYLDSWPEMKTTSLKNRIYDGHPVKFKMNWPKKNKTSTDLFSKQLHQEKNMVSLEKAKNIKFIHFFFSPRCQVSYLFTSRLTSFFFFSLLCFQFTVQAKLCQVFLLSTDVVLGHHHLWFRFSKSQNIYIKYDHIYTFYE